MGIKLIAANKKAYHDYFIDDVFEAGIILTGTEVKSLRLGKASIKEAFCRIKNGEVFINNLTISPYEQGNRENHDPTRMRKLLLHHAEILKLTRKVDERGFSIVPTRLYFKESLAKVEIGLGKGKQLHDKRETLKEKQATREIAKDLKSGRHD